MKTTNKLLLVLLSALTVLSMGFSPVQPKSMIAVTSISPSFAANSTIQFSEQAVNTANSDSNAVSRVSAADLFDFSVVQQPSGNAGYVSSKSNTLTQFAMASNYGSTGILAHNNLAGKYFKSLSSGKTITVTYSDGSTKSYTVSSIKQYQALSPSDPYSSFIDLDNTSTQLSSTDLFLSTFGISGALVLQTCISKNGNSSWGRLFVIAYAS